MRFRVLGPLEIRDGDATIPLAGRRQATLLVTLLANTGRTVPLDSLTDALWGEHPPRQPRNAIQTHVARLRALLGDVGIATRSSGYVLEIADDDLDATRFDVLVDRARRTTDDPAAVRELLDEALALWRGRAFDGFDEVAGAEAHRLEERRLLAIEERARAGIVLGDHDEVAAELDALIVTHPFRDRLVELHARALAAADRVADALKSLRELRERLADEAGLDLPQRLRDLERQLLRGEHAPAAPTTERSTPSSPSLPVTSTSLVGRAGMLASVTATLFQHRVVTLTGPGGVGKTRLAAELAWGLHDGTAASSHSGADGAPPWDEVTWIELAPITDPTAVEHVIAQGVEVDLSAGTGTPRERLIAALAGRRLLLVVDNAEHLLDAAAELLDGLQRHAPQVRLLVTSRERLAIEGEHVVAIPPLDTVGAVDGDQPGPTTAGQLFLDRAGITAPSAEELATIHAICAELDGLPLAIELAAARYGALPLDDLLAALRDDLEVVVGQRRGMERHRDLWAVVDWSYRLLDPPEQQLFAALSVHAGSFSVDQAHEVGAPEGQQRSTTLLQLATLTEASLVSRQGEALRGGGAAYRLLRPLRAFARQQLADRGDRSAVERRHTATVAAAVERAAGPPLTAAGQREIEELLDDLREVRRRAVHLGDDATVGRLVAASYRFDYWRSGAELLTWAEDLVDAEVIAAARTGPPVYAAAATASWRRGDLHRARSLAERGTRLGAGHDDPSRAPAYEALGDATFFSGELDQARVAYQEEVRLARIGRDPDAEVIGLTGLALISAYRGDVASAIAEADAAGEAARTAGPAARAFARYVQGECRAESEPEAALPLVDEALGLARACDARFVEGVAWLTAATLRARHHDPRAAIADHVGLLEHWRRSGDRTQQWTTLRNVADLLSALGDDEAAVMIATASEAEATASPTFGGEAERLHAVVSTARRRLDDASLIRCEERGRHLSTEQVIDLALARLRGRSREA